MKLLEQGVIAKLKDSNFTQGQVTNPEARSLSSKGKTVRQILLVAAGQVSQEC